VFAQRARHAAADINHDPGRHGSGRGILVDDATVAIENINRNLESGKELEQSILDGSAQIAVPALVSTLTICIFFVPMFFLAAWRVPLRSHGLTAVVFAMLASYLLSRTPGAHHGQVPAQGARRAARTEAFHAANPFIPFQLGFEAGFESFRHGYLRLLNLCMDHGRFSFILFLLFAVGSVVVFEPWLGQDFFPLGWIPASSKIHVRAHTGTRIEETAALCDQIDSTIRSRIPAKRAGHDSGQYRPALLRTEPLLLGLRRHRTGRCDIQVQLTGNTIPPLLMSSVCARAGRQYPASPLCAAVDIVTDSHFGPPSAPIDIQVVGPDMYGNHAPRRAQCWMKSATSGAADARIQQPFNYPIMT